MVVVRGVVEQSAKAKDGDVEGREEEEQECSARARAELVIIPADIHLRKFVLTLLLVVELLRKVVVPGGGAWAENWRICCRWNVGEVRRRVDQEDMFFIQIVAW